MRWNADFPGSAGAFCRPARVEQRCQFARERRGGEGHEVGGRDVRVLIVSMGALENGPIAPEMRPMIMCWYDGSSSSSGWYRCAAFFSSWYAVKFAPVPHVPR